MPPRILGLVPDDPVVPVTTTFRLSFSEALNPKTVTAELASEFLSVVLVPRSGPAPGLDPIFTEDLLSDLGNPPLSQTRADKTVAVAVALESDDTVLTVTPGGPLDANRAYVLIVGAVRDTSGNPLVDATGVKAPFTWAFTTDAGRPSVRDTDIGSTRQVFANRKRISVTFNQPVVGVDTSTLVFEGSPPPPVESVLLDESAQVATVEFSEPATGCARLAPGAAYALVATGGIRGISGQPLAEYREDFAVSADCDLVPNTIADLTVSPGETSVRVAFSTSKPSSTELRYGRAGAPLDCLGAQCPALGAPTREPGAFHGVEVADLEVNVDYVFEVRAEDLVGSAATATGTFRTAPLPKVEVNELLADAVAGRDDDAGEFIELYNHGAEDTVSLDGWSLRIKRTDAAERTCALPARALAPGAFVVLAKAAFDGTIYGGVDEGIVARFPMCDLVNGKAFLVELLDAEGRIVSSFAAPSSREGRSYERLAAGAVDICLSPVEVGPSPGRANSATAAACE